MIVLRSLFVILNDISLEEKHQLTLDVLCKILEIMGN
jgi:hypothetical protein